MREKYYAMIEWPATKQLTLLKNEVTEAGSLFVEAVLQDEHGDVRLLEPKGLSFRAEYGMSHYEWVEGLKKILKHGKVVKTKKVDVYA